MFGAGDTPDLPGVTLAIPAPAPAPAATPEVSTPCPPTERFASLAIVSLILKPALLAFKRLALSSSERDFSRSPAVSAGIVLLGSIKNHLQAVGERSG